MSGAPRRYVDGMGGHVSAHHLRASAGHTIDSGFDLAAGYGFTKASDTDYHTIGLRLTRYIEFPSSE